MFTNIKLPLYIKYFFGYFSALCITSLAAANTTYTIQPNTLHTYTLLSTIYIVSILNAFFHYISFTVIFSIAALRSAPSIQWNIFYVTPYI